MKKFNFFFKVWVVVVFVVFGCVYFFDIGYIFHGIRCTYLRGETSAQIDDYIYFLSDTVRSDQHIEIPNSIKFTNTIVNDSLRVGLEKSETVAFLVVKNDSVVLERYWGIGGVDSYTNSFSMAKSIMSLLVGCAINEGYIDSFNVPIVNYLPEVGDAGGEVTIKHLLEMSSGLSWLENYKRPISVTAKAYYGSNLESLVLERGFFEKPGVNYRYNSGNTQLLGILLKRAVKKPISSYAGEALWSKIGAKNDALWSLDGGGGIEKTFCCFNSNARDFAKIGLLLLSDGVAGGDTVVRKKDLEFLLSLSGLVDLDKKKSQTFGEKQKHYTKSWWRGVVKKKEIIYARGFLGQYIVVIPDLDLVFVRLGKNEEPESAFKNEYQITENLLLFTEQIINDYSY